MESKILMLVFLIGTVSAATWRRVPPPKPAHLAHKEGCYIKEIDDVIPYGKTITPIGYCYRIECGRIIDYDSCGMVGTDDLKCYITETDTSKPYPDCCPDVKCDEDNDIK